MVSRSRRTPEFDDSIATGGIRTHEVTMRRFRNACMCDIVETHLLSNSFLDLHQGSGFRKYDDRVDVGGKKDMEVDNSGWGFRVTASGR